MPRYIDAEQFECISWKGIPEGYDDTFDSGVLWLADLIDDAPTVSPDEVRGVVRCKDCKWCHAGYCEKNDDLIPWGCANKPWEDWFCADGAKMEVSE